MGHAPAPRKVRILSHRETSPVRFYPPLSNLPRRPQATSSPRRPGTFAAVTKTDEMREHIRALLADPAEADDDEAPPTTSQIRTIETDFYVPLRGARSDRRLMWMGGQPGRTSANAMTPSGPTINNWYELFRRNRAAYGQKMKNALKPFRLNDGGFTSIAVMLKFTGALDVHNPNTEHQLSRRTLARVLHDISHRQRKPHWVGRGDMCQAPRNSSWEVQCESHISKELREDRYQVPTVPPYDPCNGLPRAGGYTRFDYAR
ncbi:hypothetical protein GQ600_18142 [Phytophthora cactorum]|nr:hypothetical protein GQ600_18142 [Phytophthora cactorum]